MTDYNAQLRIDEAANMLRNKSPKAVTLERRLLYLEIAEKMPKLCPNLRVSWGFKYLLEHSTLPISKHDLLLGRVLEIVPTQEEEEIFQKTCKDYGTPEWINDGGHCTFDWGRLVKIGLCGMQSQAEDRLERANKEGMSQGHIDFLTGAVGIYEALRLYIRRYAHVAKQVGLIDAAKVAETVADRAPKNFREALQLHYFVSHIFCTLIAPNPTLCFGRMDRDLWPFYENDIKNGAITREFAGELILDYYCKHNLSMGRGEHLMSGQQEDAIQTGWLRNLNFDAPQYLTLGGTRTDNSEVVNDLTLLFIEKIVPEFKNPVIVVHYTPDFPEDAWLALCDKMRKSASIMVYNDSAIIPALIAAGIEKDDAEDYSHYGCNWPEIPANSVEAHTACMLPNAYSAKQRKELFDYTQKRMPFRDRGLVGVLLDTLDDYRRRGCYPATYDQFEDKIKKNVEYLANESAVNIGYVLKAHIDAAPGRITMRDCLAKECIERVANFGCGGSKYYKSAACVPYISTFCDSVYAIYHLVYEEKSVTFKEMLDALENDFNGYEKLRLRCCNLPKVAHNDMDVMICSTRIMGRIYNAMNSVKTPYSEHNLHMMITLQSDTRHPDEKKKPDHLIGATPDGRKKGERVSFCLQPSPNTAVKGLSSTLSSMAALAMNRICSGPNNLKISKDLIRGGKGLKLLADTLRTYFEKGGMQIMVSAVNAEDLIDAQKKPEEHRDIMVRITGYSAVFVDMCKDAQNEIILREQM